MILRLVAIVAALAALSVSTSFGADITVGFVTLLSGPGASIGIPYEKGILASHAYAEKIGDHKIKLIRLDDASDPSAATRNAEGSEASSSRISLILWTPIFSAYAWEARIPFSYGIPIEAPGPLSEVTKPTVISAPKLVLTDSAAKAATIAARRKIMIDLRTVP